MTIFFYKGLTRNPEIGNTPVWVLPNIWRLGRVMDTKFGTNVSNRMLLNAAKFQGYSFYRFWVIQRKPTAGVNYCDPDSVCFEHFFPNSNFGKFERISRSFESSNREGRLHLKSVQTFQELCFLLISQNNIYGSGCWNQPSKWAGNKKFAAERFCNLTWLNLSISSCFEGSN